MTPRRALRTPFSVASLALTLGATLPLASSLVLELNLVQLQERVNDGPLMDPDFDGVENILEFVLRTAPMTPSTTALPAIQQDGGQWIFEYDRNDDSLPPGTTQVVQYGDDLSGWTDIIVPATSSGAVTITPGTPTDRVRVVIPNQGTKVFARLMVAVTP